MVASSWIRTRPPVVVIMAGMCSTRSRKLCGLVRDIPGVSANPRSLVNPPVVERDLGTRNVIRYVSNEVEQLFAGTVVDPRRQRFHERHGRILAHRPGLM
jgi:hypothetical protein